MYKIYTYQKKTKLLFVLLVIQTMIFAQKTNRRQEKRDSTNMRTSLFKDTLDNCLDMSEFLLHPQGFIPVPKILTEPALGNIGLAIVPVFIQPNKVQIKNDYIPPNITAISGAYTANNTWAFGTARIASLPKYGIQYRLASGYSDANMDFYRETLLHNEKKYSFNFKVFTFFATILYEIGKSDFYTGLEYNFIYNKIHPEFDIPFPDYLGNIDIKNKISSVGLDFKYDKRDNIFTPDNGLYAAANFIVNAQWTGSDFEYQTIESMLLYFLPISPKWISGFRFESKLQFGDAPFYLKPFISLRGVPRGRYQGDKTFTFETEQRYNIVPRWSIIGFGGLAKAPSSKHSFNDARLIYNYGTGFRYLMARLFKLRTGIDFAFSNEDFGWYIVFGTAWTTKN